MGTIGGLFLARLTPQIGGGAHRRRGKWTVTRIQGYAVDCTLEGELSMTEDRLREELNHQDQFVLLKATLTRLTDGSQISLPRVVLNQEELLAVDGGPMPTPIADDARGSRRLHTVRHRRRAKVGPYSVVGSIHERPGVAPLGSLRTSSPFVVFTEARIAYQSGGSTEVRDVPALLVNGRLISWIGDAAGPADEPAADHEPRFTPADAAI